MPIHYRPDDKPVIELDPRIEISPFTLFRKLSDKSTLLLVDVRRQPGSLSLAGAIRLPHPDWSPPADREVVLFDDDGTDSVDLTCRFQQAGFTSVRALFGGLDLYQFSLDPEVVGHQTFLVETADP